MKYLAGVLALAALCAAEPEADPLYSLYTPHLLPYVRPYYASGYAGPLPGHSYQAVHRLHRREAEADPQLILNAAPYATLPAPALPALPVAAPVAPVFSTANAVFNAPVVKSVVEAPAVVSHAVHAAPVAVPALGYAAHPFGYAAPAPLVAAPATVAVGLNAHDCVTEGGCALRAALATGLPAATVGSTSVVGRKRREAEAEPEADADAEAEADPFYSFYGYGAFPYGYGYNALPYTLPYAAPYTYAPYNYAPYVAAPAPVVEAAPAPVVKAAPVVAEAPAPVVYNYAPAAPAPVVYHSAPVAAPVVETVQKQVTYTHLGAHPITPTTVLQSESRLVGR